METMVSILTFVSMIFSTPQSRAEQQMVKDAVNQIVQVELKKVDAENKKIEAEHMKRREVALKAASLSQNNSQAN
jgi:Cu/Ag efflux protein CusF